VGEATDFKHEPLPVSFVQGCIAFRLDDLVAGGLIPVPTHIKVDVDGIEPKVVAGARDPCGPDRALGIGGAQSQPGGPQGFGGRVQRVRLSPRSRPGRARHAQGGAVQGASRTCFQAAELYTAYQIANAPVKGFPYPHCFVRDVFAPDFYDEMQRNLPDPAEMIPILEARQVQGYEERFVLELHKGEHLASLPEATLIALFHTYA
jgi:hypothetical protein